MKRILLMFSLVFLASFGFSQNTLLATNESPEKVPVSEHKRLVRFYSNVIEVNPKNVDAYKNRAKANIELKNYKEAIKDYNSVIRYEPDNADAYYNRAVAKVKIDDYRG